MKRLLKNKKEFNVIIIFIGEIQKGNYAELYLKLKERLKYVDDVKVAITTLLKINSSLGKIDLKATEMTVLTKKLKS
ncbi:hypothetical protein [Aequorivita sp. KMM 9714]|uniref:hypothetical protein n=1 Tax=Aequorivita sp. KMM 9714 TaxID=2707173 RepID=UPI0013EC7925|nr:hypothetical protein [Aequorivita sp. KMM 9714]NGX85279.1 hypothetical protein [Aequorivita sp. KMM 9714]